MKKLYNFISVMLVAVLVTGCTLTSKTEYNPAILIGLLLGQKKVVAPKMASTTLASLQKMESAPFFMSNAYAYSAYDVEFLDCVADDTSASSWRNREANVLARLASPIFSGFTYATYNDGDTFTTPFFSKTVTTTVSITDTVVTYSGVFNDGGGFYKLTIDTATNMYTFEQKLIIVARYVDPSQTIKKKYYAYAQVNGVLNGVDTDGAGYANVMLESEDSSGNISIEEGNTYNFKFKYRHERSFFGIRMNDDSASPSIDPIANRWRFTYPFGGANASGDYYFVIPSTDVDYPSSSDLVSSRFAESDPFVNTMYGYYTTDAPGYYKVSEGTPTPIYDEAVLKAYDVSSTDSISFYISYIPQLTVGTSIGDGLGYSILNQKGYGSYQCPVFWYQLKRLNTLPRVSSDGGVFAWQAPEVVHTGELRDYVIYNDGTSQWTYVTNEPSYYGIASDNDTYITQKTQEINDLWGTD